MTFSKIPGYNSLHGQSSSRELSLVAFRASRASRAMHVGCRRVIADREPALSPIDNSTEAAPFDLADLDGDGDVDLVGSSVFLQQAFGRFSSDPAQMLAQTERFDSIVATDLDGDGEVDIVVGEGNVDSAAVRVFYSGGR